MYVCVVCIIHVVHIVVRVYSRLDDSGFIVMILVLSKLATHTQLAYFFMIPAFFNLQQARCMLSVCLNTTCKYMSVFNL